MSLSHNALTVFFLQPYGDGGAGLQPARRFVTGASQADYKSAAGCKPAPQVLGAVDQ